MKYTSILGMALGIVLAAVAPASATLSSYNQAATLTHYWSFDEAVTGVVAPMADTANIYWEGASALASPMTPTSGVQAVLGLDGGQAVRVGNSIGSYASTLTTLTTSFTYESWVRYDASSGKNWDYYTPRNGGGAPAPLNLAQYRQNGNTSISASTIGGSTGTGNWPTTAGQWYFMAVVADAAAQTISLYITPAGQAALTQIGTTGTTYNGTATGTVAFGLGGDPGAGGYGAAATFDWAALWNTPLSVAQVTDHYLNGLGLHITPPQPPVGPHMGDANGDKRVDLQDFSLLKAYYGQTAQGWEHGNFNNDANGLVNLEDFSLLKAHYNHTGDAETLPVTAVPEPASLSLLALLGVGLLKRSRKS